MTEDQAREQGYEVKVSNLPMVHVPRALAARDTRGLIKLVSNAATDHLLGAHILAPEAGEMIQTTALAIRFDITVHELRETMFPYLTNAEGLKLATLAFEKDMAKLSCCAGRTEGTRRCSMHMSKPMTIGQLARRTGVSIKALREYEHMGLIYTLGRSESNYRLFDESALWCVQVIGSLRSLGLTLKEIQDISAIYCERPGEPIGPLLAEKLDEVLRRVEARISDLQALRHRILDFQATHAPALKGQADLDLYAADPRRRAATTKLPLDSPPGGRVYALLSQPDMRRVYDGQRTHTRNGEEDAGTPAGLRSGPLAPPAQSPAPPGARSPAYQGADRRDHRRARDRAG